jgi:hypothetical protein
MAVGTASMLLLGCATTSGNTDHKRSESTLTFSDIHVSKNDGTDLSVSFLATNNTAKALLIKTSEFALTSGTTTISPLSTSQLPNQIPAHSKTKITLDFKVHGQLSGTIHPRLAFQPSGNAPEKFMPMGTVKIPHAKIASKSHSTGAATSSSTHDYQADIDQDYALIKSKVPAHAIVNTQPDAEVPDGFGHMLYAWNVILNGDGDGTSQQIYFFIDNRYIGTDTSSTHLPSSVRPGGTGSIVATYEHYLKNDPMCCPSGQPYIVTFHWNGSRLVPNDPQTLDEAVKNQFN